MGKSTAENIIGLLKENRQRILEDLQHAKEHLVSKERFLEVARDQVRTHEKALSSADEAIAAVQQVSGLTQDQ